MILQTTSTLKKILKNYYQSFTAEKKIAWCTSVGPSEILISMGFNVYYPENHGALLGASRLSGEYMPFAYAEGYSQDSCSYLTSDIGAFLAKKTPLTSSYGLVRIPKPDVLVYNTNQCREVQDWFQFYAKKFKIKSIGIASPWKIENLNKDQILYVASQFRKIIPALEEVSKTKFDIDKLSETVSLSKKTTMLWKNFLKKAKNVPSPVTFFDSCIQMAPAVVLRGLKESVMYYKILNKEIDQRINNKQFAVKNEKTRIFWDGMPIWGKLRFFSDLLSNLGAAVVASTYCNSWVFEDFNDRDPFNSMAEAYTKIFINRSENIKEKVLKKIVKSYNVAGVIFHDSKTCPYNSNSRFGMPQRLSKSKIRNLVINGDLNDLSCFSEEQTKTSVEAFIEQITE